jgi:DNA-binding transcriptional ArsR family regulator
MPRLFPSQSQETEGESEPRLVGLEDADDEVFDALTSETARSLLAALYEEPRAASELADSVGTSLQNARYHLDNLQSAGIVDVVGTCYSSKGTEMDIYAPAGDPLMLVVGDDEEAGPVRQALRSLAGDGS